MAEEKILVITNDSRDYSQANLEENLMKIGLSKEDAERFVILGLEKIEGFQVRGRAILRCERRLLRHHRRRRRRRGANWRRLAKRPRPMKRRRCP